MKQSKLAEKAAAEICADAYQPNTYSTESDFDTALAAGIIDAKLVGLVNILDRARTLMPLGTKIRAEWLTDASEIMRGLREREK